MKIQDPKRLARYLKGKKDVLLLAGSLCDEVELDGGKLLNYAAQLALKLKAPVGATANTNQGLRQQGVENTKKMYAAELVKFMQGEWLEPITPRRPKIVVLVGYPPEVARSLLSNLKDVDTVVLGPSYLEEATRSTPDLSLKAWGDYLGTLVQALEG